MIRRLLLAAFLAARTACAGLEDYAHLLPKPGEDSGPGIRVTYLGVNGYEFRYRGHSLLVDPYFSRLPMLTSRFGRDLQPDLALVHRGLREVAGRVDALLVTHAHIDHLFDAPPVIARTGARLFAGPTALQQMRTLGVPESKLREMNPAPGGPPVVRAIGPWKITAWRTGHDRLLGRVPFPEPRKDPQTRPRHAADWVLGEPLSFLIEAGGRRIFINSGASPDLPPPRIEVDLAILGVALPDARAMFATAVRNLQPTVVIPSHQDDFFRPACKGFRFSLLSDFSEVEATWKREGFGRCGRLLLLDYFKPWMLR